MASRAQENGVHKPRLIGIALNRDLSLLVFAIPVGIALGSYVPGVVSFFNANIAIWDPWTTEHSRWKWALSIILFVLTGLMAIKQWSYYYRLGSGKAGFFVETCGCFNDREEALDIALSFWGGLLFLSALRMPSYWLLLSALYSGLVVLRCWVTLRRKMYATIWSERGEESGPRYWTLTSTFPRPQTSAVAQEAGLLPADIKIDWATTINLMKQSLDWTHETAVVGTGHAQRPLAAKEILAGWLWSHSIFLGTGIFFSVFACLVEVRDGPNPTTCLITIGLCLTQVSLFRKLSRRGERWGIKHANRIVCNSRR